MSLMCRTQIRKAACTWYPLQKGGSTKVVFGWLRQFSLSFPCVRTLPRTFVLSAVFVVSAALFAAPCPLSAAGVDTTPPAAPQVGLTLIYGANLPEIATKDGGLPELGGVVERARAQGPVCFLFGGDSLGPSILGALDRGAHMIDVLNQMEPDAFGVSKREFIFHEDELSLRATEAFFPLLSSNVEDPLSGGNVEGLENSLVLTRGGMTLGIFAVVDTEVMHSYPPDRMRVKSPAVTMRRMAASLRQQGVDKVIAMTDFVPQGAEALLEEGVIDVLLMNNSDRNIVKRVGKGVYAVLESGGRFALEVQLPSGETNIRPLKDEASSVKVKAKVDSFLIHLEQMLSVPLGVTTVSFDTSRSLVRTKENAFGNFVADAMRHSMGADVALINGGVIRGNKSYAAGQTLLRRDIRTELPFHDEVAMVEVSGKAVREALENGFSRVEEINGRFPHVSGLEVTYDPAAPVGRRVLKVMAGGKPLDEDKLYKLATTRFVSMGGDEYGMLVGKRLSLSSMLLGDVVGQRVSELGSIAPVVENRLQAVDAGGRQ